MPPAKISSHPLQTVRRGRRRKPAKTSAGPKELPTLPESKAASKLQTKSTRAAWLAEEEGVSPQRKRTENTSPKVAPGIAQSPCGKTTVDLGSLESVDPDPKAASLMDPATTELRQWIAVYTIYIYT